MGALPKRKLSKARRGKRRSHLALKAPSWITAPSAITQSCRIMPAPTVVPMLAERSSRYQARQQGRNKTLFTDLARSENPWLKQLM